MTVEEKAAAFDLIAAAFTNQFYNGKWAWWVGNPAGGAYRDTRQEATADLLAWCATYARRRPKRLAPARIELPVIEGA